MAVFLFVLARLASFIVPLIHRILFRNSERII